MAVGDALIDDADPDDADADDELDGDVELNVELDPELLEQPAVRATSAAAPVAAATTRFMTDFLRWSHHGARCAAAGSPARRRRVRTPEGASRPRPVHPRSRAHNPQCRGRRPQPPPEPLGRAACARVLAALAPVRTRSRTTRYVRSTWVYRARADGEGAARPTAAVLYCSSRAGSGRDESSNRLQDAPSVDCFVARSGSEPWARRARMTTEAVRGPTGSPLRPHTVAGGPPSIFCHVQVTLPMGCARTAHRPSSSHCVEQQATVPGRVLIARAGPESNAAFTSPERTSMRARPTPDGGI